MVGAHLSNPKSSRFSVIHSMTSQTQIPYELDVTIPGLPACNTARNRHWRASKRNRDHFHLLLAAQIGRNRPSSPLLRSEVTFTRASSREPDYDNLAQSFKPILASLVRLGVCLDDRRDNVGRPEYRWERAAPRHGAVRVQVREAGVRTAPGCCPHCGASARVSNLSETGVPPPNSPG